MIQMIQTFWFLILDDGWGVEITEVRAVVKMQD